MRDQYFELRDQSLKELEDIQEKFQDEVSFCFILEKKIYLKRSKRS
jgi:hypothetical protein